MCRAGDVMQRNVISIKEDASIREAMETLVNLGISGLPVVGEFQRLVGIITEFQLLEAVYLPEIRHSQVRHLMTTDVVTVTETTILSDVTNLMLLHGIRRLPVVRGKSLVGVIARRDVLRYVLEHQDALEGYLAEVKAFAEA